MWGFFLSINLFFYVCFLIITGSVPRFFLPISNTLSV